MTKADWLKYSEIKGKCLDSLEGTRPNYKRKRAYHRALKRGALWALFEENKRKILNDLVWDLFK